MKVTNKSSQNFGAIYLKGAAIDIAAKAKSYMGTAVKYEVEKQALERIAGETDLLVEPYGDMGAAIWKGKYIPEINVFEDQKLIAKNENIIEAFKTAARKLEAAKQKLEPKTIRQRFPGTGSVKKLDKTV